MNIAGLGVVFSGGAGVPALLEALKGGRSAKGTVHEKEGIPVLSVAASILTGPSLSPVRRADRFCKMAILAAQEAWQGSQADPLRTGLILSSAFGPHGTVFRFLNEMLEFGAAKTSPTVFSQSVHAAAASMIASATGIHGSVLSLADLAMPFEEALALAEAWLKTGRCDSVLVGAVDELSDVLVHVARRQWQISPDGYLRISSSGRTAAVPGEGAVFFRVERGAGETLSVGRVLHPGAPYRLLNAGGLGGMDCDFRAATGPEVPSFTYAPLWGSTRIGGAFHLAAAELMRREGLLFPEPIPAAEGYSPPPPVPRGKGPIQVVSRCGFRLGVMTLQG